LAKEATFVEHLKELRRRIIVSAAAVLLGAVAGFVLFDWIFAFFAEPFENLSQTLDSTMFVNTIFEGFAVKMKLSIISGTVLSLPVHLYNIIAFVFPGLLPKERRIVGATLAASFTLAILAFYYGYFHMIPISIRFLTGMGFIPDQVGILLGYGKNIFYVLQLLFLLILLVQLPVVLEILMVLNVLKRKALLKAWRYVVMAVFPLSAIFTPPDFVSQLIVAVPLIILFFGTILIARIFHFGEA
jgi:sec-independent protein translocase protein TatC